MAVIGAALSALSGIARADDPNGAVTLDLLRLGEAPFYAPAGATVKNRGWTAGLFVSSFGDRPADDETLRLRSYSTVGAQLTGRLSKDTRLTIDVFNVFDQPAGPVDYFAASRAWGRAGVNNGFLSHPGEGRGLRVTFKKTF